jgi:hypothetical protein
MSEQLLRENLRMLTMQKMSSRHFFDLVRAREHALAAFVIVAIGHRIVGPENTIVGTPIFTRK